MTREQFQGFINDLRHTYQLRSLPDEVMDFLFGRIGHLPVGCVEWISEKFVTQNEKFPTRLHTAILWLFNEWRKEHKKTAPETRSGKTSCKLPYCDEGLIHVRKEVEGVSYVYTFRCQECDRSDLTGIPAANHLWLKAEGYHIDTLERSQAAIVPPQVRARMTEDQIGRQVKTIKEKYQGGVL